MQTITLEGSENITIIRSLLEQATEREVLLVVPRGCEALENKVNLMVLRRWADNLTLHVALVTADAMTAILAREAGLVVLPSLEAGQLADLAALDSKRRRHKELPPRPTVEALFSRPVRPQAQKTGKTVSPNSLFLPIIGGGVFVILLLLLLIMPSATVTLKPISEPVAASMDIAGVAGLTDVSYSQAQVPARSVSVELTLTDTIATTDKRDVPDGHAEGSVVFVNKTTTPVTITQGTVVRTSFGENVRFYTVADAGLPGELHRTVRVGILAAEPGLAGNVPALTINVVEGELAAQVDVLNDSRTSGGTVRRMSVVHGDDKIQLRAKATTRIQEEAYQQLISSLTVGDFIPAESLEVTVLNEEFDHKIGDTVDTLGITLSVRVSGLAVSGAGGEALLSSLLEQRMKPGYRLVSDSAQFERGQILDATQDQAHFTMSVKAAIAPTISTAAVRSAIVGKSVQEAQSILMRQFSLASEPRITLAGTLLGHLPWLGARIRVLVTAG